MNFDMPRPLIFCLVALPLFAHDLYIMPPMFFVPNGQLAVALNDGDAFPESEVPMKIERLRDAMLFSRSGNSPLTNARIDGKRVLVDAQISGTGHLLLTGRTAPNFIELKPDQFVSYLKEEGLTEVIEWRTTHNESARPGRERYSKFFKSLILSGAPDGYFNHVVGHAIEIVPEKNPYMLKPGETLPVQVLFRGKPAAGLQVESAFAAQGRTTVTQVGVTGADGRIHVPLTKAGKYRLHSLRMERCAEPAIADWESYWASLTFELR